MSDLWLKIVSCPLCADSNAVDVGMLPGDRYYFGGREIIFPLKGVSLKRCIVCSLVYKTSIPSQELLADVFNSQIGNVWNDSYSYLPEKELVISLLPKNNIDLLDIGPSNGGLLKAFSEVPGRRSGLDIVMHTGLDKWINSEFINNLIDDDVIKWSGQQYGVVTAFDVFEHFYNPKAAINNLKLFLKKGGYILLETGDAASVWPRKYGINNWSYVRLFEHHIFWTRKSLEYAANEYNLSIIYMKNKKHKLISELSMTLKIKDFMKVLLYKLSTKLYVGISQSLGRRCTQPSSRLVKDHLFVILRND